MKRLLIFLQVAMLCFCGHGYAWAQQPFVLTWLGDGSLLSEFALGEALYSVYRIHKQPDHIIILLHGYNVVREDGGEQFQEIADNCYKSLTSSGHSGVVVGLEWDSAAAGAQTPWRAEEAYLQQVARSRVVGHNGARQFLLRLQQEFPQAHIDVLSHSLGCEVAMGALFPSIVYADDIPKTGSYAPESRLHFNCWALAGSDLDYNVWAKGQISFAKPQAQVDLLWMTISPYSGSGFRDQVLQIRQMVRGMAGGSAWPHMTEEQLDNLFSRRAIVFDQQDIPQNHEFVSYFNQARLERILASATYIADRPFTPSLPESGPVISIAHPSQIHKYPLIGPMPEIREEASPTSLTTKPAVIELLDKILAAPNRIEQLLPWLDSKSPSAQLYALWRLERILCGGSQHFADETLDQVTRLLRNTPRRVWSERANSACQSIRRGYWPSESLMIKAGAPAWSRP